MSKRYICRVCDGGLDGNGICRRCGCDGWADSAATLADSFHSHAQASIWRRAFVLLLTVGIAALTAYCAKMPAPVWMAASAFGVALAILLALVKRRGVVEWFALIAAWSLMLTASSFVRAIRGL